MEEAADLRAFFGDFLTETREGFEEVNNSLLALEKDPGEKQPLDNVFRVVHTIKSSAAMLGLNDLSELARLCEDLLESLRRGQGAIDKDSLDFLFAVTDTLEALVEARSKGTAAPYPAEEFAGIVADLRDKAAGLAQSVTGATRPPARLAPDRTETKKSETIRVRKEILDALFNLAGELIIIKNRVDNIVADVPNKELKPVLAQMGGLLSDLHENIAAARLAPVGEIFQRFPRLVRDLAKSAGKDVDFVVEGANIELDKSILDILDQPLVHLLRNAVDHGIESPDIRARAGKARAGKIKLAARRAEDHIMIEVEDDGGGIDINHMRQTAVFKAVATSTAVSAMTDNEVINLIFAPGFSAAAKVTDVSGRGVGLDVVKNTIKDLSGTIEVATEVGLGTRFTLVLPISTAMLETLLISIGSQVYAIPSNIVTKTLELTKEELKNIHNRQVILLDREVIPFFCLRQVLGLPTADGDGSLTAVIIAQGQDLIGLGVDGVIDQVESIIKPFDPIAQQFTGFSGGTILGDGRVVLLLDIPALFGFESLRKEKYSV